ncbi:uncharacterized protein EAE98_008517 [Botrytis deweyae]|uniref:CBM21 domain-containing protein n=1 Tax=Botrytis deweyae TaxID=2478750 RepID=A0ABQ7IEF8_9HELO|nr:uncharacterized protein EAE98_008517 [Botrytis deweyae]KAF7921670.1 hypothetical protein EAE98_008517 [Botrytis deweyae]
MASDSAISIGSSPQDSNDSDATSFNRSDTTLSMISDLSPPGFNESDIGLPRVSELLRSDSDRSDFTLPGFSNPLPFNNFSTQLQNYPDPLNHSGVTDQRNLRLPISDGHTLDPGPLIPPKLFLSQPCLHCSRDFPSGPPCSGVEPCFECVKSNKFCSFPRSAYLAEPGLILHSPLTNVLAADNHINLKISSIFRCICLITSKSIAHLICGKNQLTRLRSIDLGSACNHPTSHPVPEHELTEQVAAAVIAIPLIPDYIIFRYYLQGRVVWDNDYLLVRDLKRGNDDCIELRAFNLDAGSEYHGCKVGWYQKNV